MAIPLIEILKVDPCTLRCVVQSLSAVTCPGVLEPDLNDTRWEVQLVTETVNFFTFGAWLIGKIAFQDLHRIKINQIVSRELTNER